MTFHKAKKVVIVAEKIIASKIAAVIEEQGGKGYTVVQAGGKGEHGSHYTSERAAVVDDFSTVRIEVVVADREVAERISKKVVEKYFDKYSGIVYLMDVEIIRTTKFSPKS
ncbi:MAG: hypothetical protein JJU41_03605 [Bacteroidetes bacterium]|nr:hypothetical protein [Bacteroidota bacterium]